jgi:hypothetical protein
MIRGNRHTTRAQGLNQKCLFKPQRKGVFFHREKEDFSKINGSSPESRGKKNCCTNLFPSVKKTPFFCGSKTSA